MRLLRNLLVATALVAASAKDTGTSSDDLCMADDDNTFHLMWDPYASETGYFKIKECGDTVMPTIMMKRGVEYTFDQTDKSNWYHAVGFAYFADGAHNEVDELEPGITQSGSKCVDDMTCQAPMYFRDGEYVGGDYNNERVPASGGEDFGLDVYEPEFFFASELWEESKYVAKLTLTDDKYDGDLFYFCHIHNKMSARIKQVDDDGKVLNEKDEPELGYEYQVPSDFDKKCGTYGTGDYQESSGKCDGPFICTEGDETDEMKAFGECLYAMDCAMEVGMQSILNNENPIVTFIHQMIPHHANAVNMAKALLKTNTLDDSVEEDADMLKIVMEIINVQNFQINQMQGYLAGGGYPPEESCDDPEPTGWSKKREPSKDCEWASEHLPQRCTVKGADGTLAKDSCPELAKKCK
jgi:hypothetical protein